ncbi:MAG: ATP-dependent DNA helicase [Candidatus Methanomethylophilaceae archaeon]
MDVFPYVPRGQQTELVSFITEAVLSGRSAVIESGTGTGKTVCSLTAVINAQAKLGNKILYLTRTKSQQKQVMTELRAINGRTKVFGIAIQGRNASTCPLLMNDPELSVGSPDELSRLCSEYKKKTGFGCGCQYFAGMEETDIDEHIRYLKENLPDPEVSQKYCTDRGLCPYEMMKKAIPYADVICVPYSFLMVPNARRPFLKWVNAPLDTMTVIVDEAHNIPDYLREVVTSQYTYRALELAEREAKEWEDPKVSSGIAVTDLINAFRECFREAIKEYLIDEDGLVPPFFLEEELMHRLRSSSVTLDNICKALIELGEIVADKKRSMKKLPRSYMGSLGKFLRFWISCDEEVYVKLINGGENPSFEAYCMDPYVAAQPLRECRSSIHMSGTLEPLDEYIEELGLKDAMQKRFDTPFDPDNLLSLYVDDVTTKHDLLRGPDNIARLKEHLVNIVTCTDRNAAVFFPSYKMMDSFIAEGIPERLGRDVHYERREMSQTELMDTVNNFRASEGSALFAVAGGRVSEGLDFPDKDLELAVLIGIPYPYPNVKQKALVRYCDIRFGNGWEHAVRSPTVRKMRQARGRLIRSETDRGVSVVLDRRIAGLIGFDAELTNCPCEDIRNFFKDPIRHDYPRNH